MIGELKQMSFDASLALNEKLGKTELKLK